MRAGFYLRRAAQDEAFFVRIRTNFILANFLCITTTWPCRSLKNNVFRVRIRTFFPSPRLSRHLEAKVGLSSFANELETLPPVPLHDLVLKTGWRRVCSTALMCLRHERSQQEKRDVQAFARGRSP